MPAQTTNQLVDQVKEQCQKGIPASLRAKCWPLLCGASDQQHRNTHLYQSLDSKPALQSWVDVIERDLDRQFPFHEMFVSRDGHGQRGLFRVLKAFTQYQPEEGYCQAQGPVAAVLLMNMPAEEAFWCLVQISQHYLPGYYSPLLEGVLFDAAVLTRVLKRACPAVHKHLANHGVEPLMFATDWLMCLYTRHLPFNTLLRVWDLFFCYGVRVLFQVAVVLVRGALGRAEQRGECQGQMETLERLRAIRGTVAQEDHSFISEVLSVPLSGQDLQRLTERELDRWRRDRPGSTFDPRGRCHGYRMAWERIREREEARGREEREKGNLAPPASIARSPSTLSLSPSLLRKRWMRGRKTSEEEGGSDGGGALRRESWMESSPALSVLEEKKDGGRAAAVERFIEPPRNREPCRNPDVAPPEERRTRVEHPQTQRVRENRREVVGKPAGDRGPPSDAAATGPPHHRQEAHHRRPIGQSQAAILRSEGSDRDRGAEREAVAVETKTEERDEQLREGENVRSSERVTSGTEMKAEGGTDTETGPEVETETGTKAETGTGAEVEMEAGTETEVEMEAGIGAEVEMEAGTETEVEIETETGTEVEMEADKKATIETKIKVVIETGTATGAETDVGTGTETEEAKTRTKTKAKIETETGNTLVEPEPDGDMGAEASSTHTQETEASSTHTQEETHVGIETPEHSEVHAETRVHSETDTVVKETVTVTESNTSREKEETTATQKDGRTEETTNAARKTEQHSAEVRGEDDSEPEPAPSSDHQTNARREADIDTGLVRETWVDTYTETGVDTEVPSAHVQPEIHATNTKAELETHVEQTCEESELDDSVVRTDTERETHLAEHTQSERGQSENQLAECIDTEEAVGTVSQSPQDHMSATGPDGKCSLLLHQTGQDQPGSETVESHVIIHPEEEEQSISGTEEEGDRENNVFEPHDVPSHIPPSTQTESSRGVSPPEPGNPTPRSQGDSAPPVDSLAEPGTSSQLSSRSPPLPDALCLGPSGEMRLRKSSSSRGSRPARRLSEDLFTVPQLRSKLTDADHRSRPSSIAEPSSPALLQRSNQAHPNPSLSAGRRPSGSGRVSPTHPPPSSPQRLPAIPKPGQRTGGTPRRFGLFRRLRGEQQPKVQIPKILIQDFSDVLPGERTPREEEEKKLSSKERRRRRRERERREKEEEKLRRKRDKEAGKEKERERRKPQTRGKSFQVQGSQSAASDTGNSGTTRTMGSEQRATPYAEAYF